MRYRTRKLARRASPATLTREQKQRAREATARLGDRLAAEGYRGFPFKLA